MRRRRSIGVSLAAVIAATTLVLAPASAADDPVYYLPASAGTALIVAQGNHFPAGRTAGERYAFDFIAAEGAERFPVLAARGGRVIGVRAGVRGGRCTEPADGRRPSCWRDVNYVLIDHGDGTSGLYMHLKRGQPLVRRGEVVSVGQRIGSAGASGWTEEIGLQFQLQRTPTWNEWGRGGWFQATSLPVAFADEDVATQRADGVPRTDDMVISGNPGAAFEPFRFRRRPTALPATVPFEAGPGHEVSAAYDADSPDGYGLHFAPLELPRYDSPTELPPDGSPEPLASLEPAPALPGTAVRPLFGGELVFAGCASGASASLGRTVVTRFEVDGTPYFGVLGHLSDIDPALLDRDPGAPALIIGPDDPLGHFGAGGAPAAGSDGAPVPDCAAADAAQADLFTAILRDATVTPEGEISGGIPVSPEPLVGQRGYEGFAWWSGPVAAAEVIAEPGRPGARWNSKTPADGAHIRFGDSVRLVARVRDRTDIREVRFRAWYPRWPRVADSASLDSFDPATSWRQLARCPAPIEGQRGFGGCRWNGDTRDALVSVEWDPLRASADPTAPWLPRAMRAMTSAATECVPVSLAVEVIDRAGHVYSEIGSLPLPSACDEPAAGRARSVPDGPWTLVTTVPKEQQRYRSGTTGWCTRSRCRTSSMCRAA